ncbi:MAG: hypothetical protein FWC13_09070 [Oscillospiraceae bacterium]|nr:hypothetical protein [Oscillospiraceae bacterium]
MVFVEFLTSLSWLSVVLFVIGMVLVVAEMFQPGFGLFGTFGIISLIGCVFVTANSIVQGVILTVVIAMMLLILFLAFLLIFSNGKIPSNLILTEAERKEDGYVGTPDYSDYLGKTGFVTTICRPVGSADFDGDKLEVVTMGEFIDTGKSVEVIEIEGNRIVVREFVAL